MEIPFLLDGEKQIFFWSDFCFCPEFMIIYALKRINLPCDATSKKMRKVVETLKHLLLFMFFSASRLSSEHLINSSKTFNNVFSLLIRASTKFA